MRLLILFVTAVSLPVYGSAIGTASALATCSFQGTTQTGSSCYLPIPGVSFGVAADAAASANGAPWKSSVDAGGAPDATGWSASAYAKAFGDFSSGGAARTGLVKFDVIFSEEHADFSFGASISDGTNNYASIPVAGALLRPYTAQ